MEIGIIEANMVGLQHSVINRLIITMINNMNDVQKINLYCNDTHYSALSINALNKVEYKEINVVQPGKHRIVKFFVEYSQTKRIIKNNNYDLFILLSCFPNVHYFLSKNSNIFKNKKILIVTHGEAEGLIMAGKWKFWSYPFWITKAFKSSRKDNFYRLVLGKSILNNLEKLGYSKNIYYINHPYEDFMDSNDILPIRGNNIFGYIGNCLKKKGGETFVSAANDNASFVIIGTYGLASKENLNRVRILSDGKNMISYKEFNENIKKLTYACYPYPSDSYKLTASGAVFDAIKYLKPIIYIGNDYFDEIFKGYGNIGYRCENEEDFVNCVSKLSLFDDEIIYKEQVNNLRKIQKNFMSENIQKDLEVIIQIIIKGNNNE